MVGSPTKFQRRYSIADKIEIKPEAGHRKEVVAFFSEGLPANEYIEIDLGGRVPFRLYGTINDSTLIADVGICPQVKDFLQLLREKRPEIPRFNTAQDEILTLIASVTPTRLHLHFNDLVGVDVVSHTLPGASDGYPRLYVGWCTHSKDISATGSYELDTSLAPVGSPPIRDKYAIPSTLYFDLIGMIFASTSVGATQPTYFHIWDREEELFTADHSGFPVIPGHNELIADIRDQRIFLLEETYRFDPATTMFLKFDAEFDGTNVISAGTIKCGLIGLLGKPV